MPNRPARRPARTSAPTLCAALLLGISIGTGSAGAAMRDASTPSPSFRHVTALGTTKPDGAALDVRHGTTEALDRRSRELGRIVRTAICTGC